MPSEASWRAVAARRFTRATLRPLGTFIPATPGGVRFTRRLVAGSLAVFGPPLRGTSVRRVQLATQGAPAVRGEWVLGPGVSGADAAVLYIHGSGYAICSARTHRGLTSRLSADTGLPVFACDYRLAPSHRFPAAADDVRSAFEWLLTQGFPAHRIALAGDSAGGHLAMDLIGELGRAGLPLPAAVALFSPLVDPTFALAGERDLFRPDPMISAGRARRLVAHYLRDADAEHPRLALPFDPSVDYPPTLVHAGGAEMLAADAEYLARRLRALGARCELRVWPGQMHVFQALPALIPEARPAVREAAAFLREELVPRHGTSACLFGGSRGRLARRRRSA
ncbi:acetyl esterase/lipase [Pseudonocardia eucalypti]|uniref:alpha/beta hydrolase n=1 Tax=Pseudonocardia eucalypti TaxID=648755 RepID=UPI0017DF26D4|nr:acetyl esterase/lipase [Pseudonocardia eucalypti]